MEMNTIIWFTSDGKAIEAYSARKLQHLPRKGEMVKLKIGVQNAIAYVQDVVHTIEKDSHVIEVCLGRLLVNTGS